MTAQPPLQFGPYRLDGASSQLWRHTQVVKLPPKALAVLWCLATQAGQVVTKATLLDTVWAETAVSEGVLAVCIRDLRRALGDDPQHPRYIETVHTRGYRFVAPVAPLQAPPAAPAGSLAPPLPTSPTPPGLVGREEEVAQVQACLEQARRGQRQVLFVTGEAGIGKTTLVDACMQKVEAHGGGWVGWGQCVDAYGPGTGYLPLLEALGRLCRGPAGPTVLAQLQQWAPAWLAQLSGVLDAAEQARLQRRTLGTTRERLLRELAVALEALTQAQLGVLVLEDLHWSDPSTVEVLTMLARRREAARLLILGTYRPVELIVRAHPLKPAMAELALHGHCTELALPYLTEAAVAAYVAPHFPAPVAQVVAPIIYQRTAGHPLFMVHLAAYLAQQAERETHTGEAVAARVAAIAEAIPAGVQQLIELQLEHLHADEQRVLAMASVVGGEFAVASVAAGMQTSPDLPEEICATLAQQGQFLEACGVAVWPDGTVSGQFRFRHAVYQQVLYRRLGEARRVQGHRRIGARLEAGYGARTTEIAAALAVHFERGQDVPRAMHYHYEAGQTALRRAAYREAIDHLTTAGALLATLPDTPERARQELALQMALGPTLFAIKGQGASEVEQAYQRAHALCHQIGETEHLVPVLVGLRMWYFARAELQVAHEISERLLRLVESTQEPALLLEAHRNVGMTAFCQGELAVARTHLEQGMLLSSLYASSVPLESWPEPAPGMPPAVGCLAFIAWTLWALGYVDQALQREHEALRLAQALTHPVSVATVLCLLAMLHLFRREGQIAQQQAEAALSLATEHELAQIAAHALIQGGGALVLQGHVAEGMARLTHGLTATRSTESTLLLPYFLSLMAGANGHVGQPYEGLRVLTEALALVEQTGERWWQPELYRLQGELVLQHARARRQRHLVEEAEECLQHALVLARHQQAKSLELRAAMSLTRLWQRQGKCAAAHALLAPLYDWFTEGFDTVDLQEARALLEERA